MTGRSLAVRWMVAAVVVFSVMVPLLAAAKWTGRGRINYLHSYDDRFKFHIAGRNHNCGNPDQQFEVLLSQGNAQELYDFVLMAYMRQIKIRVNYSCASYGRGIVSDIDTNVNW